MRAPTAPCLAHQRSRVATSIIALALAVSGCATRGGEEESARAPRAPSAVVSGDGLLIVGFDADQDYRTTRAELDSGLAAAFPAADADSSGDLSPLEWRNWAVLALGGEVIGPFRLDIDRNVDNRITQEEFVAEFTARFESYDQDQDGAVTRADMVRPVLGRLAPRVAPAPPSARPQEADAPPRR